MELGRETNKRRHEEKEDRTRSPKNLKTAGGGAALPGSGACGASMEDIDEGISAFLCPITNAVFEEPVVADDGRTYSQLALLEWFASCRQQGLPITSPFTRAEISERVVPNFDMAKAIKEYQAERVAAATTAAAAPCAPVARGPQQDAGAVTSLAELGSVFALLDGLRGLLAETLDGWQPPQIVVVGQESSGKSSVLERLMMVPILPRDEVCELCLIACVTRCIFGTAVLEHMQ